MLKPYGLIPLVVLIGLAGPAVRAQQMPDTGGIQKRFEQMNSRMEDARKAHGAERQRHMHDHMQMMHEQMQAMQGMMGDGMPGMGIGMGMGPGSGMGRGPHGPGGQMDKGGDRRMQHMQSRMDLMQKMMEQMQKQHELMLKDDDDEKEKKN